MNYSVDDRVEVVVVLREIVGLEVVVISSIHLATTDTETLEVLKNTVLSLVALVGLAAKAPKFGCLTVVSLIVSPFFLVWNSLSPVTKSSATITTFKAHLKTELFSAA